MKAIFDTECGMFTVHLALTEAPITAGYFRDLIENSAFDGASFFRIVSAKNASIRADYPIEVVQGGLRETDPQPIVPIMHEPTSQTGLSHKKWSLSAARYGSGETYGSFFICMRDEPELDFGGARHPDGLGFAVFGQTLDGFETLETIFQRRERDEFLKKPVIIQSCKIQA